jgi:hypothetical protein
LVYVLALITIMSLCVILVYVLFYGIYHVLLELQLSRKKEMKMKYNILLLLLILLIGCQPTKTEIKEVGTLISITVVPTSFNESIKSTVITTKGNFTVYGNLSGLLGEQVRLVSKTKGSSWYLVIGERSGHKVINF